MSPDPKLPYWQVNVPLHLRETECPPFLRNCTPKELRVLSTPQHEYKIQSWESVCETAQANKLDVFQRTPSELRRYKKYIHFLIETHGTVLDYMLRERLFWEEPVVAKGQPFECEEDVRILMNDWPYGIDPRIVHLVVWTKFELKDDEETGDLTDEMRAQIEDYVQKTFCRRVPGDQVIWFKNWRGLKSVQAVEHFHVLLFDPDPAFVEEITNGDRPRCEEFDRHYGMEPLT